MFDIDRDQSRQLFFKAWEKHKAKQIMEPLESQIASVIELHPEYHAFLENPEKNQDREFFPEMGDTNPFLHMGLHIAIREQLSINQPIGIKEIYNQLLFKHQDPHTVEHLMIDCLAQTIWEAQRNNAMPDNEVYLNCLKALN
jgi:hypothetical protein